MLDYSGLHFLSEVIRYGSFERGAQALNLTQSAVSQKIKRLEHKVHGPVLVRAKPLKATDLGAQLLAHYQKVCVLEEQLAGDTGLDEEVSALSVAVNNDVLATWFSEVMAQFTAEKSNPVHIYNADQSQTRSLLQQGKVMACISQTGLAVAGAHSVRLGTMDYQLYASPAFIQQHLSEGISPETVNRSPGLIYDEYDVALLSDYQQQCMNVVPSINNCHWYPSSHGFAQMAVSGAVWALLPALQVKEQIEAGQLVNLFPGEQLSVPLFWHWFDLESAALTALTRAVKQVSKYQLSR